MPASCDAVYCNQSCLWVCDSGRVGGVRTLLQPARTQCLHLSEHFFILSVLMATFPGGPGGLHSGLNNDGVNNWS